MRIATCTLLAFAGLVCSASVFANAGTTSAGVTTTDPNAPSTDVQQQSSGFVAANQQLQNGIAMPGTAAGGVQAGESGASAAGDPAGSSTDVNAAAGHANGAENPATPAAPPPPPPNYESRMRPLNRSTNTEPAAEPPPPRSVSTPAASAPTVVNKPPRVVTKPAPAPTAAEKPAATPTSTTATNAGGGRGEAPDGYTFWLGLIVAGALLALALTAYLRIGRGETPN
ncbi:MAG: hypothetical protein ACREPN_02400 [Rudaea sp.]